VRMFPTGEAYRWRSITEMVPGKNAAQGYSRTRSEDFIKAHLYPGEKRGTSVSELPFNSMTWNGDTDARLAELITDFPGGTTRRWRVIARELGGGWSADDCLRRAASLATPPSKGVGNGGRDNLDGAERAAQPEPALDETGECVVLSGAEDDSLNGNYYRSYTEDLKSWELRDGLICYRHTSNVSTVAYLWLLPSFCHNLGSCWGCAFESSFHKRGNVFECKLEIESSERGLAHPAQVQTWHTIEWAWDPELQSQEPMWTRNGSIKVEVASAATPELDW